MAIRILFTERDDGLVHLIGQLLDELGVVGDNVECVVVVAEVTHPVVGVPVGSPEQTVLITAKGKKDKLIIMIIWSETAQLGLEESSAI